MRRKRRDRSSLHIERLPTDQGFQLRGPLDVFGVDAFNEAIEPELHGELVLDCGAVDFIDDSGLGALMRTLRKLRDQGGTLVIRNAPGPVRRVFEVTGIAELPGFRLEDDADGGLI